MSYKDKVDIVQAVEAAGVELRRAGNRHVGICPFHADQDPSFYVFDDGHFYCFGCHEGGDAIHFIRKLYGLSFPQALRHLGIEQGGRPTPKTRLETARRKRKTALVKQFREWCLNRLGCVGTMIFEIENLMLHGISPDDLDRYAPLLHALPMYEYHQYLLINGTDKEIYQLLKEAQKCKVKNSTWEMNSKRTTC